VCEAWARSACHRGGYSSLAEAGLDEHLNCPMDQHKHLQVSSLPLDGFYWHQVGRPGGYSNIALEEYSAYLWSLEDRLRRPMEFGRRVLHIGDNGWQVCAEVKGRSSNRLINRKCRRSAAVQLSGDLTPFLFWEPSGRNWADAPSSWFGVRAEKKHCQHNSRPQNVQQIYVNEDSGHWDVYRSIPRWVSPLVFVHFCSGRRRQEDLEYWLHRFGDEVGIEVIVFSFDLAVSSALDILDDALFSEIRALCWSGRVFGTLSGVPCTTWCRLLCSGTRPSPMRTRSMPWGMSGLTPKLRQRCDRDSSLALRGFDCLDGVCSNGGLALQEHPVAPGGHKLPSLFLTPQFDRLRQKSDFAKRVNDQ
jgi:hypothetical protein